MSSTLSQLDGLAHVLSKSFQDNAAEQTHRWDKEWMRYLSAKKDYWFYFYDMSSDNYALGISPNTIAKMSAEEVSTTMFYKDIKGDAWVAGADLVGKDVLEIGCGPGVFGRLSGRLSKSYTGIDISRFALSVARLTSPKTCRYFHLYDPAGLETLAKSVDLAFGRHFFIHHNYEDSLWLLQFLRDLVRDGGLIMADFFCDAKTVDGARRRNADQPLSEQHPSALFHFEDADIERLAAAAGLRCEAIDHRPERSSRFARLRVGGTTSADGASTVTPRQ
ncbi:MAG: class I SAM-dependent methyltransferase [Deltaproteobacteria bacterium]|nr:class I SAM-dependent methyltransferase [Deltaproteobacteria bacterium]